jgi:hypothetical protein
MHNTRGTGRTLWRALAGAFAGVILGSLTEVLFWDGPPSTGVRFPLTGALIGGAVTALFGVLLGSLKLRGGIRIVLLAALAGVVVGLLAGAFVYPPLMMALYGASNPLIGKLGASYRITGILVGIPVGAVWGLALGALLVLFQRGPDPVD